MADLVLRKCGVCHEDSIPLDQVLFFQCGHWLCRSCTEHADFRRKSVCHECKQPIGTPHRIYLHLDDLIDQQASEVVSGLRKIDLDTPAVSVERAAGRIRRMHKQSNGDPETSKALLDATKELEERIAPLYSKWAEVKRENDGLVIRLQVLEASNQHYQETTRKAKHIARYEREESERLGKRAEGYRLMLREKDIEIMKLQKELEEREKKTGLLKTKLKALTKAERHKRPPIHDSPNTSLQIGCLGTPGLPTKKLKRPKSKTLLHDLNVDPDKYPNKRRKDDHLDYLSVKDLLPLDK
ncbi:hypothetical protein NLJ89_g6572 [Agrocybe chaxingu]|uniref:RING-type domain-containing protein n=1 Tax=Agrocybe chaxingu TaxID=84603 RepID=A0A9W8JW80_9AGAR|nr:hypothetical protein NLJ89_g6572 [Agrocybe chaxingu]